MSGSGDGCLLTTCQLADATVGATLLIASTVARGIVPVAETQKGIQGAVAKTSCGLVYGVGSAGRLLLDARLDVQRSAIGGTSDR